jgi:hypothetical protein
LLLFGDPPDASLPELANYRLKATRTRIPRLLAATNTQGSPRIIGGQIGSPVTLKATFDQDTALAPIGGAEYLAKLAAAGAPLTRVEVQDYARLVSIIGSVGS